MSKYPDIQDNPHLKHFTNDAQVLAYIEAEFIATLEDDAANMESEGDTEGAEEMRAKIADVAHVLASIPVLALSGNRDW